MLQISRTGIRGDLNAGRDIVQRFAEKGYQLEPEALELICAYPGAREELIRQIIGSLDRSVAVIRTSHVSIHVESVKAKSIPFERAVSSIERSDYVRVPDPVSSSSFQSPPSFPSSCASLAELKCDITGRSTCVGDYEDFVCYFRDRYAKIREILSRRLNSRPIESLGKEHIGPRGLSNRHGHGYS